MFSFNVFAADDCEKILAQYAAEWEDGLAMRGYMGNAVPPSPENLELGMKYGLTYWGGGFRLVPSLEEAIAHRLKVHAYYAAKGHQITDLFTAGLYILGNEEELGLNFEKAKKVPVPEQKIAEFLKRGAYQVDVEGNVTYITPEHLARRFRPTDFDYHDLSSVPEAMGRNSVVQQGWVTFKQHGIHDYSTWKDSKEAKRLRRKMVNLVNQGWTIQFNVDYELMLKKIRYQDRTFRRLEEDENGNFVPKERMSREKFLSRYSEDKPEVFNAMLNTLKSGKGYSVGLYTPEGVLKGGEIGVRQGNHFYGDSIFHDEDVDYAKIAALALFEALYAAGMPYSDPGMITPYTQMMGAEMVPHPEFVQKIKSGPKEPIVLSGLWDPRTPAELEFLFNENKKKMSQGLGHVKLVRRTPIVSDVSHAENVGMDRVNLSIVFVKNFEQAIADAQSRTYLQMPIYIEVSKAATNRSALDFLNSVVTEDVKAYFIPSARHPEHLRKIEFKQLKAVLELNVTANPPAWIKGAELPTIQVEGWGFRPPERR